MNIKKFFKNKSPYRNNATRVRNSYYTFSREYPAGNIPIKRRIHLRFKSENTKKSIYVIVCILLLGLSFFNVRLLLDISYKAPKSDEEISFVTQEIPEQTVLEAEGLRALYMPYERLGDTGYIRSFIKKIDRKDCNGVVIDFKTESGKLCYSSLNSYAINSKCAIFDNNTVREALSVFKKENIIVAARVFCFLDNTIPSQSPGLAVKYMDTDVNWIDTAMGDGGKTWLNPCSKAAQSYLLDIINELKNFNIDGFILEKCHFPDSGNTEGASFPGEKNFKNKNAALSTFIRSVKESLKNKEFLIISQSATDALNGNKKIFFGNISSLEFDGVAAYTLERPEDIVLDKKSSFAAMFGLFSSIEKNYEGKTFLPVIDFSEYSRKYIRTIKKNCESFILSDIYFRRVAVQSLR